VLAGHGILGQVRCRLRLPAGPGWCPNVTGSPARLATPARQAWGLTVSDPAARDGGIRHVACFYRTSDEYLELIQGFVRRGLTRCEPVFVAVPKVQLPPGWQLPAGPHVTVADMQDLGGNPARIIPAVRAFADSYPGQRVRYLGEPAWPTRSAAELQEAVRNEALINLAFGEADVNILCPYNVAELPGSVISDVRSTHPTLRTGDEELASEAYLGPADVPASLGQPLLAPDSAQALSYEHDLRPVRSLVAAVAGRAGLAAPRCTDLVIAASEVAANTLRHTSGGGVVRLWTTHDEVLCQIEDTGFITDPLAGYRRPAGDLPGGQGLWLVNQVCDLAEIRTSTVGTTIRLHMSRRRLRRLSTCAD
jgi:anti-sigma regulatory factor (Ser/Thr protein kinase)